MVIKNIAQKKEEPRVYKSPGSFLCENLICDDKL